MIHALLFPGQENSGRLVALLRQKAKEMAKDCGSQLILSDGPPGIGCPVISALSGVHLAIVVTEPTPSGLHDMIRITDLCEYFQIPVAVIINKCDLNEEMSGRIETQCEAKGLIVVARLPHTPDFVHAMVQQKTITEFSVGPIVDSIRLAWQKILMLVTADEKA